MSFKASWQLNQWNHSLRSRIKFANELSRLGFCESFGNAEAPILEEDRFCCRGGSQTDPQRLSDPGGFVARP